MGDAELALRSAARRGAATRITHSNARSGQGGYFCVEAPAAINTRGCSRSQARLLLGLGVARVGAGVACKLAYPASRMQPPTSAGRLPVERQAQLQMRRLLRRSRP